MIAGVKHWLRRAVDQAGMVPDALVQSLRDQRAAKRHVTAARHRAARARAFDGWAGIRKARYRLPA